MGEAALLCIAGVATAGYSAAVAIRNAGYRCGLLRSRRVHVPVISVGNLTTGGTGKTPMVMHIADRLRALGHSPAVLMRGFMPDAGTPSDEAALYRERRPDLPVIVDPDRIRGAATVQREHPSVDVLILDDGFQHRRIARDLDLVLIDAALPWGYGHMLPRGLMREPRRALRRADAVVLTHCEQVERGSATDRGTEGAGELAGLRRAVQRWHGRPPLAHAAHAWARIIDAAGGTVREAPEAAASPRPRVVAFCGLGHPEPFFHEAGRWCDVVAEHAFGDHQRYDADFADWLNGRLAATGAVAAVTSEKDWARLQPALANATRRPTIWRASLALRFAEGPDALDEALKRAIAAAEPDA